MGLKRGGRGHEDYVGGYLRQVSWFRRRDAFVASRTGAGGLVACVCCDERYRPRQVDVHHLSYDGVSRENERWISREADDDLMVLCRWCHERVHTLMDTDRGWAQMGRREATVSVVRAIQRQLTATAVRLAASGS